MAASPPARTDSTADLEVPPSLHSSLRSSGALLREPLLPADDQDQSPMKDLVQDLVVDAASVYSLGSLEETSPIRSHAGSEEGSTSPTMSAISNNISKLRMRLFSRTRVFKRDMGLKQWQKIWVLYKRDRQRMRTLGISIRAAVGCLIASCFVNIPQLYNYFPSSVQGMLCNAVVMVTFAVGDTLGETVSWCVDGTVGLLVAFANYHAMFWATSWFEPELETSRHAFVIVEFFLFTLFVNVWGASYMARQMAMGYYAFYGLCLLNEGCNLGNATACELWTLNGALISIFVMLWPPCPSAARRVFRADGGTLVQITKATARATTLTTSVFLAVEEETRERNGNGHSTGMGCSRANGGLAASVLVIQEYLDALSRLLKELEADLGVFWWEAEFASADIVHRFVNMMRTTEGCLLMQRQGVLFNYNNDIGEVMDGHFLESLRADLGELNVKTMRLLGITCRLLQYRRATLGRPGAKDMAGTPLGAAVEEARELVTALGVAYVEMRLHTAQRNVLKLPDLGTGRTMFIVSVLRQSAEIMGFASDLCNEIDKDRREAKAGKNTGFRAATLAWSRFLYALAKEVASSVVQHVKRTLNPHDKPWAYSFKAAMALTFSFVLSAKWFNYDSMSVSATAYLLGAHSLDLRCLGGTIWKALCRVIGVMVGGIVPGRIHNFFVPASHQTADCYNMAHVFNGTGTFIWCFAGVHLYKINKMATTEYGHFGYVGLVMAFVAAEQFLSGCQNQVPESKFVLQTIMGAIALLLIECTVYPRPACLTIHNKISQMFERQVALLSTLDTGLFQIPLKMVSRPFFELDVCGDLVVGRPSDRWTTEIQWLEETVSCIRSGINQAMAEDTFKVGHTFFLWMPPGYSSDPIRPELCKDVLDLLQQLHLNVLFVRFAKELEDELQRCQTITRAISGNNPDEPDLQQQLCSAEATEACSGRRSPLHWHNDLQNGLGEEVNLLRDGLRELMVLVGEALLNHWQSRDLSVQAAAGLLLQRATCKAGESEGMNRHQMQGVFRSVLEHADPGLSDADIIKCWCEFKEAVKEKCKGKQVSPTFFQKAMRRVLQKLSGRPSLDLGRLDALMRYPNQLLKHAGIKNNLKSTELRELIACKDPSDTRKQEMAMEICYQMALLDSVLLMAFTARQLSERLGHFCGPISAEEEEEEGHGRACLSQ